MLKALLLLALAGVTQGGSTAGSDEDPVVRAVLFFSPTCPHCHKVIQEDLPWIFRLFGGEARVWYDAALPPEDLAFYVISNGRVEILLVDAATPLGNAMYRESAERLNIPPRRQGVPRLVVADSAMVGSLEIPAHFPDLIEKGLAAGGVDWPALSGLDEALAAVPGWAEERERLAAAEEEAGGAPAVSGESAADSAAAPGTEAPRGEPAEPGDDVDGIDRDRGEEAAGPSEAAADTTLGATPAESVKVGDPSAPPFESPVVSNDPSGAPGEASDIPDEPASGEGPAAGAGSRLADIADAADGRATVAAKFRRDPVGNGLAVLTLGAMIGSVLAVVYLFLRGPLYHRRLGFAIPALALIGMGAAGYLSYVETSGATAVCGPVGDCNAVQQSEYAILFGVLPVGVLGLVGYVAMLAAWLVGRAGNGRSADAAKLALLFMAFVGTAFSIYLTFLEPFVIGATCAWCLTSAVTLTLVMWLSVGPARESWLRLQGSTS